MTYTPGKCGYSDVVCLTGEQMVMTNKRNRNVEELVALEPA